MTGNEVSGPSDVRVHGNQHGTQVILTGQTRELVLAYCALWNLTPEEFLDRALRLWLDTHALVNKQMDVRDPEQLAGRDDV